VFGIDGRARPFAAANGAMVTHGRILVALVAMALASPRVGLAQGARASEKARAERQESRGTVAAPVDSTGAVDESPGLKKRVIARAPFGDAVIMLNARSDGQIEVAAAAAKRSNVAVVSWQAVRLWADSADRILATRARPGKGKVITSRAVVEEPGVSGGAVSLVRKASRDSTEWSLFFADSSFGGFSVPIEKSEASVFIANMRRAVTAARKLQSPEKRSPDKK
jgi:hypothetical protein